MKVSNFKGACNQFILQDENATYLQSYDSIIIKNECGKITLGKDWNYSKTTSKYRGLFLGKSTKETQNKIDKGIYTIDETL